jgi:hypothetical protein
MHRAIFFLLLLHGLCGAEYDFTRIDERTGEITYCEYTWNGHRSFDDPSYYNIHCRVLSDGPDMPFLRLPNNTRLPDWPSALPNDYVHTEYFPSVSRMSPAVNGTQLRYTATDALFGPSKYRVVGQVVFIGEWDGCSGWPFQAQAAGKILVIGRGGCFFDVKTRNAQDAGAIAVIHTDFRTDDRSRMQCAPRTDRMPFLCPKIVVPVLFLHRGAVVDILEQSTDRIVVLESAGRKRPSYWRD